MEEPEVGEDDFKSVLWTLQDRADINQQLPWFSAGDPGRLWEGLMSSPLARELWPIDGF